MLSPLECKGHIAISNNTQGKLTAPPDLYEEGLGAIIRETGVWADCLITVDRTSTFFVCILCQWGEWL